ncbi:MAG: metallophosphoesterase [SAR324 cluster bacterium]|nr:metallophosphoesterase [SAR324 cluster bacterium]
MQKYNFSLQGIWVLSCIFFLISCSEQKINRVNPPPKGSLYHFNVFGDSRSGNAIYSSMISVALTAGTPAFNVHIGDMISTPAEGGEWQVFKALSKPLLEQGGLFPIVGNHDVDDQASLDRLTTVFPKITAKGYYSRVIETCFCVFLNSEALDTDKRSLGEVQMNWLKEQLVSEAAQQSPFIAIFVHRPPFPQNHHKDEPLANYEEFHQLMIRRGVALIFSGHEHSYTHQVKDGVNYVISGTSGSPVFKAAGKNSAFFHFVQVSVLEQKLVLKVFDLFGRKRDEFEILL